MKKISEELVKQLQDNQEKILGEIIPAIGQKDYLKKLIDPSMLPILTASFMQSLNNSINAGNLDSFRNTVDWLFQMAIANGMENPLENNLDFLTTVQEIVRKYTDSQFHSELDYVAAQVKEVFIEVYKSKNNENI